MSAILPFVRIDSAALLAKYFTTYQICWIEAEDPFHEAKKQVFALAEKSVRIGWTFCDGFKNVRKRLRFKNRDYLFVTKDWPSALEYMNQVYDFADMLGFTRAVLSHGEDVVKVKSLDPEGHPTSLTEEVKIGYIKFQNGSRIIAFSSNPYAMAVYGGDVGLDEFARHPNAKLLWQTAQARVTWACDLAVWSSHDGEDTLFNQFAQQARACCSQTLSETLSKASSKTLSEPSPNHRDPPFTATDHGRLTTGSPEIANQKSKFENPQEHCPRCHSPLPPRASNGERPSPHCQRHDCGAPVRNPEAPYEPCPHCGVTLPDLLPNGQRPHHACPECKKPLPHVAAALPAAEEPGVPSGGTNTPAGENGENLDVEPPSLIENQKSKTENPGNTNSSPWNLYFKVTMPDAVELGLLDVINRTKDTAFTPERFIADCQARSGSEEVYQQSYMCNPLGAATASIVEWSAIERCRHDYPIERVHLEAPDVTKLFGEFDPNNQSNREHKIHSFLQEKFPKLFSGSGSSFKNLPQGGTKIKNPRLGFDVAASGHGDLAAFYFDESNGSELWLRALLTARTEDWDFLKTALFFFLRRLPNIKAAGDESGLGRQICWEAAKQFSGRFLSVNFSSKKSDLGFSLMNQLSVAEKRFPKSEQDIAADFFALRKIFTGSKWIFTEGRNTFNPASHCDIAWAGALATHAHTENKGSIGCAVLMEDGTVLHSDRPLSREQELILSEDPRIWRPFR